MKKGPRCPVCGSLQIKESAASKAADLKSEAEKLKDNIQAGEQDSIDMI